MVYQHLRMKMEAYGWSIYPFFVVGAGQGILNNGC